MLIFFPSKYLMFMIQLASILYKYIFSQNIHCKAPLYTSTYTHVVDLSQKSIHHRIKRGFETVQRGL